jgi:hypothetical protein
MMMDSIHTVPLLHPIAELDVAQRHDEERDCGGHEDDVLHIQSPELIPPKRALTALNHSDLIALGIKPV